MSFTDKEIREDYLEKVTKVFTGTGGVIPLAMCREATEKSSIKNNPAASMQRRIERIFTDPSGKKKTVVFVNKPRITGTFKEKEIQSHDRNKENATSRDKGGVLSVDEP